MESSPGPHRGFAGGDGEAAASVGPLDWAVRVTGAAGRPPAVRRVALGALGPGSTVLGVQGLTGRVWALHRWVRSDGRALGAPAVPRTSSPWKAALHWPARSPRCQRRERRKQEQVRLRAPRPRLWLRLDGSSGAPPRWDVALPGHPATARPPPPPQAQSLFVGEHLETTEKCEGNTKLTRIPPAGNNPVH